MMPDFSDYTLALVKNGNILHSSAEKGLAPLVRALDAHAGERGLTLHDKVQGLAAARAVLLSGIVSEVFCKVASEAAVERYRQSPVILHRSITVPRIENTDGTDTCPMERMAMSIEDDEEFKRFLATLAGGRRGATAPPGPGP